MPEPNSPLPQDPQDRMLSRLTGLPNGAHTQPSVVQTMDYYGNVANFTVQTVRWDEGNTVFVTKVDSEGHQRFMLPPKVINLIVRQADAVSNMVKRRHGKRLAEQRKADGWTPHFTPEMRVKALKTRQEKAAKRKARRKKKSVI